MYVFLSNKSNQIWGRARPADCRETGREKGETLPCWALADAFSPTQADLHRTCTGPAQATSSPGYP
jgi:hypothetical protein